MTPEKQTINGEEYWRGSVGHCLALEVKVRELEESAKAKDIIIAEMDDEIYELKKLLEEAGEWVV